MGLDSDGGRDVNSSKTCSPSFGSDAVEWPEDADF